MVEITAPPGVSIVLLVGLPASGKSSLAAKLENTSSSYGDPDCPKVQVVTLDLIQQSLQESSLNDADLESWHSAKTEALKRVQQMVDEAQAQSQRTMVIVDDTFEYASMRKVYYQLARDKSCRYLELRLECPIDQAIANNTARNALLSSPQENTVTEQTIRNVHSRMQDCQFDPQKFLHSLAREKSSNLLLEADPSSVGDFIREVEARGTVPTNPVIQETHGSGLTENGLRDVLDQHLRKYVSGLLQSRPELRAKAKQITQLKKKALQQSLEQQQDGVEKIKELLIALFDTELQGLN